MFKYPKPLSVESGCKVMWRTYATRQEAEEASKVAEKEARVRISQGYDFGYSSPGSIRTKEDGTYTVTCP